MDTSSPTTLAALGKAIHFNFRNAISSISVSRVDRLSSETPSSLGSEYERFKIWAVDLGLLVPGHGSLDYRIREAESLRQIVEVYLNDINQYLEEMLEILLSTGSSSAGAGKRFLESRPSPENVQNRPDNDNLNDSDEEMDSQTYIDILLESICDVIDRLFKLSTKIRNPSTRLKLFKAQTYRNVDQDTGVDLIDAFGHHDYDYVLSVFSDYYKKAPTELLGDNTSTLQTPNNKTEHWHRTENCSLCESRQAILEDMKSNQMEEEHSDVIEKTHDRDPDLADFLIHRIARANAQRRKQLGYWKKHHSKLEKHTEIALEHRASEKSSAYLGALITVEKKENSSQKNPVRAEGLLVTPTVTTATRLQPALITQQDTKSDISITEYAPSDYHPGRESVDFPPPPKVPSGEKFFKCPYCFTICPRRLLVEKAWRAHLIHDLRPYVCTYQYCKSNNQLYDTRREWIEHESSCHRKKWRCPDHLDSLFASSESFVQHIQALHKDEVNAMCSDAYLRSCESFSANAERSCPICFFSPVGVNTLQNHIALHLERFATFALPRHEEHEATENEDTNSAVAINTVGSSRDESHGSTDEMTDDWYKQVVSAMREERLETIDFLMRDQLDDRTLIDKQLFIKAIDRVTRAIEHAAREGFSAALQTVFNSSPNLYNVLNLVSPLLIASSVGHEEIVQILLEHLKKANQLGKVNGSDESGRTPLMVASQSGQNNVVRLLLDQGAQLGRQDNDGNSDLSLASANGHVDVVWTLINHTDNLKYFGQKTKAKSAIVEASLNGHENVVRVLLRHKIPAAASQEGQTALIAASSGRFQETVHALLDFGADINRITTVTEGTETGSISTTALAEAASKGSGEIVQTLLDRGARVDHFNTSRNPLVRACLRGELAIVRTLVAYGADVNAVENVREKRVPAMTALRAAAQQGHKEVVKLLLDNGANIDAKPGSETAMTVATSNGHTDVVRLLLDRGADINHLVKTKARSALYAASKNGQENVLQLLLQRGADPNLNGGSFALAVASSKGHTRIVRLLIEFGADVNLRSYSRSTPLQAASRAGRTQIVKVLIDAGADPDLSNDHGSTALILASRRGYAEITQSLLSAGANPNIMDESKSSALFAAAENGHEAVVKLLLSAGAEANTVNVAGDNAFGVAKKSGHSAVIALHLSSDMKKESTDVGVDEDVD